MRNARVLNPVPKETTHRRNGSREEELRYQVALYAKLKGYDETLWGRARGHASFSSSITSLPLRPGQHGQKAELEVICRDAVEKAEDFVVHECDVQDWKFETERHSVRLRKYGNFL